MATLSILTKSGAKFEEARRSAPWALVFLLCWGWAVSAAPLAPQGSASEVWRMGQVYDQRGDWGRAATCYRNVLDRLRGEDSSYDSIQEAALFRYGVCLLRLRYFSEAAQRFESYGVRYPNGKWVEEAEFYRATALGADGHYVESIRRFEAFLAKHPKSPRFHEARFRIAAAFTDAGQYDRAVPLWRACLSDPFTPQQQADALGFWLSCCVHDGRAREAWEAVHRISRTGNPFPSNLLLREKNLQQLGEALLKNGLPQSALEIFSMGFTREQILEILKAKTLEAAANQDPSQAQSFREQSAVLEKNTDYNGQRLLFRAWAYAQLGRHREAAMVYQKISKSRENSPLQAHALVGLASGALSEKKYADALERSAELIRSSDALAMRETALRIHLQAALALGRSAEAMDSANQILSEFPHSEHSDQALLSRGYAEFSEKRMEAALRTFEELENKYPRSLRMEDAAYGKAMSLFYLKNNRLAHEALERFIGAYPSSPRNSECVYRLAVCKFGLGELDPAARTLQGWIAAYPASPLQSEARCLLGDIQLAAGRVDDALQTFQRVPSQNASDHIHSLFQQARCLRLQKKWEEAALLCAQFRREFPDHPRSLEALRLQAGAWAKLGRSEAVETLYRDAVREFGENRIIPGFEAILLDFLQFIARTEGSSHAVLRLGELAEEQRDRRRFFSAARLMAAQGEYLRRLRKSDEADQIFSKLAQTFRFPDLPWEACEALLDLYAVQEDPSQAAALAHEILRDPSKKLAWGSAHHRLGRFDQDHGKWQSALERFDAALQASPPERAARIQLHRAQCLEALQRHQEAIADYQRVLASRAARGSPWAEALLGSAQCLENLGDLKKAAAYYQRIYVLYRAYPSLLAKAYLGSGRCLEKLEMRPAALRTYQEMLARADLKDFPEFKEARQRLEK